MPRQSHSSWCGHPNNIWWGCRSISSSLWSFLHSPVTSPLVGPSIFLSTLFSNTFSLRSSLSVIHQVSYPFKTTTKLEFCISSVQARGKCIPFEPRSVFTARSCWPLTQHEAGVPPLVGCSQLLFQYIRSYPPYWKPFLHPQPEETPCRGDRNPLVMDRMLVMTIGYTPNACGGEVAGTLRS